MTSTKSDEFCSMSTLLVHAILGIRSVETSDRRRDSHGRMDHSAVRLAPKGLRLVNWSW
jgi:hypothetical protein